MRASSRVLSLVHVEVVDKVATLTLNVPEKLNALSVAVGEEFRTKVGALARDTRVRCVVLTGAGRAFSAGGDLEVKIGLFVSQAVPSLCLIIVPFSFWSNGCSRILMTT
jgi:enoyl-CoA hydratase/carnithine racemase